MGLNDYNRKRDFRLTTEPPGRTESSATGNSYVIQKHAASRLHYDFRLELDGVLKSWSVPKGPSFDPVEKRLAVETEDHPVAYGGFEGIIPKGQYGGGTVSLWDRGTWSPVGDAHRGLAEGHLKFDVFGDKLRGRWALVKLKPRRTGRPSRSDSNSWLLVKDRDGYARPESEFSITESFPDSVESGRSLEQIANAAERVWHSAAPRGTTTLPDDVVPVVARVSARVPAGDDWWHEIELRGERTQVRLNDGSVHFFDVRGADRTSALGGLARGVLALPVRAAVIDALATHLDSDGHTRADGTADTLYLIDLPFLDGEDLRRRPLAERKQKLSALMARAGTVPGVRIAEHVEGHGDETFAAACRLGAPGIVSKRSTSPYRLGAKQQPAWRLVRCPEAPDREGKSVAPNASAPVARAKTAVPSRMPSPRIPSSRGPSTVAGVRLTHPERILYPEPKIAKWELAAYYEAIAERLLPHLRDRPLTLVRAPDGLGKEQFYVRHPGVWTPSELRQGTIPKGTSSGKTMIVDDVAGLVALAQMNVLEIHAWNACLSNIEKPDRIVFDLDPGPEVTWESMVDAAKHVRTALRLVELESFVKTTGSKGLHVVVPLQPSADWAATKDFSLAVASALARIDGARYSVGLAKAARSSKIFIDYLRNGRGATSVSVYSTRARTLAPISTPIHWDELDALTAPDSWTVRDWEILLGKPDPWRDFFRVQQTLTPAMQTRLGR